LRFDRILCDVPCSGDGTLRKLPSKAWAGWSTNSAFSLHALQVFYFILSFLPVRFLFLLFPFPFPFVYFLSVMIRDLTETSF
jgi:hypothetical protein